MKPINNLLRIVLALALGALLIACPAKAALSMVIIIGGLFLIPGLLSIIVYLFRDKETSSRRFPIESIGSCLLGLALLIVPGFFVGFLMYVLAGILIFAGFLQIRDLFSVRKVVAIPMFFYIVPVLILLMGIVIIFNPFKVIETTFMVTGIVCIVYSVSEAVNYLKFLRKSKRVAAKNEAEDTRGYTSKLVGM